MPVADDTPSERRDSRKPWTLSTNGHTRAGRALYAFLWVLCRTLSLVFFGFRSKFAETLPSEGGLLVLASHQSHLDPLLLGLASPRRLSSLARSSLFTNRFLGEVISLLDAVPIDRESSSIGAMKAIISRLKAGKAVVIFPEGTRTTNGQLGEKVDSRSSRGERACRLCPWPSWGPMSAGLGRGSSHAPAGFALSSAG